MKTWDISCDISIIGFSNWEGIISWIRPIVSCFINKYTVNIISCIPKIDVNFNICDSTIPINVGITSLSMDIPYYYDSMWSEIVYTYLIVILICGGGCLRSIIGVYDGNGSWCNWWCCYSNEVWVWATASWSGRILIKRNH